MLVLTTNAAFAREVNLEPERPPGYACTVKHCFVVADDAEYCSVDPYSMRDGLLFATKSTLTLPAGAFPLPHGSRGSFAFRNAAGAPVNAWLRLANGSGAAMLPSTFNFEIRREADPQPLERIALNVDLAPNAPSKSLLFVRTLRWPHDQFYMGDPDHAAWFYEARRNIYVSVGAAGLFPGVSSTTVHYAPCAMTDQKTHVFKFAFENGDSIMFEVRFVNGASGVGYYMGRALRAWGSNSGIQINVTSLNDLAYFGSTRSWSEPAVPGLAVRLPPDSGVCGVLFDPTDWDDPNAVNGYFAYEMTCEERRGRQLPLVAATYPGVFVLP